jgi:small conductance mechanosensitive channel
MKDDMQMKVTEPIQTVIQKLEGWLDSFIGLIPNMAVTLLLLIISCACQTWKQII